MKKMGIRQKLTVTFLLVTIIPILIVGGFAITQSVKAIEEEVSFYSEKVVTLMGKNIDLMVGEIDKEFISLMGNPDTIKNMVLYSRGNKEYEVHSAIQTAFESIISSSAYVKGIMLVTANGQSMQGDRFYDTKSLEWKTLEENGMLEEVTRAGYTKWYNGYGTEKELLAMRNMVNPDTGKSIGVAIFKVYGADFQKQMDSLQLDGQHAAIYLLDEQKKLLVHQDKSLVNQSMEVVEPTLFDDAALFSFATPNEAIKGKENFVMYTPCNSGKWMVVMNNSMDQMMSEVRNVQYMIVVISCVIALAAIGIAIYISGGIARPIQRIVKCMQQAEEGNLLVDMHIKGDREIEVLAQSFNHMMEKIRQLISQTTAVVTYVRDNAVDVSCMATGTKETAGQVSSAIQEIVVGANEQANEVEYSMVRMQNLANIINEVASKMNEIDRVTHETTRISNNASVTIKELNAQTIASSHITKTIEEDILTLDASASRIKDVIHLIEGISEQTNLLSLNAAIEAARAGAYGRGFGVVADEVRKLAIQSKDATMKIRGIIEGIQVQTKQTVEGAHKASKVFEEQRQVVEKTNKAFADIAQAMMSVSHEMQVIHGAMGQMAVSKDETKESMECIQTIVQEVVALTEELLSASTEQSEGADRMSMCSEKLVGNVDTLQKSVEEFVIE
ncbi:MAG: methyl-accepting chemotaxis protein [Cellulosilyticaceae bacterium]